MSGPRDTNIEVDTPSSSSEDEELPPLPASRPASVISVATSLKPKSTSELRGQSSKVEKHHKKESPTTNKLKQLFTKEPSFIANIESSSKSTKPATMSEDNGIKPKNPDTYSGGTRDLERFLSQCQLYFLLKKDGFKTHSDKVLFAGSHLRGPAADWFTPFIRDLSKGQRARPETQAIFSNYANFEAALEQIYGSRNKQQAAIRQMQQLRQTGPASQYTAIFRRLAMESEWDNTALLTMYYGGLKDSIKNELARSERPDNLSELIERVISLDERFFERQMEQNQPGNAYGSRPKKPYYGPQPMDLSATRGPLTKRDREHRMKNNLCLYCGKPGHRARECNANGKRQGPALAATRNNDSYDSHEDYDYNNGPPQYLKATRTVPDWIRKVSEAGSRAGGDGWTTTTASDIPPALSMRRPNTPYKGLRRFEQHDVQTGQVKVWSQNGNTANTRVLQNNDDDSEESDTNSDSSFEVIRVGKEAQRIIIPQGRLIYWSYENDNVILRIETATTGDYGNLKNFPYKPWDAINTNINKEKNEHESLHWIQCKDEKCTMHFKPNSEKPEAHLHAIKTWTSCYDDDCNIHRSDKEGSGWFPKQPMDKQAKDEAARLRSNEERQITRLQEIPDSQDDSPQPSEEPTSTPPSSSDEEELQQW